MKNFWKLIGITFVAAVIGFGVIACDNGGDDPIDPNDNGSYTYTHNRSDNNLTIGINKDDSSNPTADFTIVINSIKFHE